MKVARDNGEPRKERRERRGRERMIEREERGRGWDREESSPDLCKMRQGRVKIEKERKLRWEPLMKMEERGVGEVGK
jgi:hypothetical protein